MKTLLVFLIRMYQVMISPYLGRCCRYYPSCSSYSIDAIKHHGCLKGLFMSVWRVLRCNPFSHGGVDFVPGADKNRAV